MLNETTVTGIQALLALALESREKPVPPHELAEKLGASPAYLGKIHTQLARAGILKSHRGKYGGVTLARDPATITLLEIVEACQGQILGDYCQPYDDVTAVCAFHAAMHEVQHALISTLQDWTLEDLRTKPAPDAALRKVVQCRMQCALPASSGKTRAASKR